MAPRKVRESHGNQGGSLAVFLASDDAGYVVAQCYGIDGGNWTS